MFVERLIPMTTSERVAHYRQQGDLWGLIQTGITDNENHGQCYAGVGDSGGHICKP